MKGMCAGLKTRRKKVRSRAVATLVFLSLLSGAWLFQTRLEGGNPSLVMEPPIDAIGMSRNVSIRVEDAKSGLRDLSISLLKNEKKVDLIEKKFPFSGIIKGGKVKNESFNILIEPEKLGISDGKATLLATVADYSWRGFFRGNKTVIEKDVVIDTKPPKINVISKQHALAQGGSGLVIYKVSEPCLRSGVRAGDQFYPGHAGHFKDKTIYLAFMALKYNQGPGTVIFAEALDIAGNYAKAAFPYYIRKNEFKQDVIRISDRFLNLKMPEFATEIPQGLKTSPINNFLFINRTLRQANSSEIKRFSEKTDPSIHWSKKFLRLPKSMRRAGFADYRIYKYKGKIMDYQIHFGMDLASVSKADVPASNRGRVAGAGVFGIYGKTIVIDHGFGLFSLYSHLSQMHAQPGQMVERGEIIGLTGKTGLAAGDHLHFGMFINDTFVNPLEWWDPVWIEKNISRKIKQARRSIKKETGEEPRP